MMVDKHPSQDIERVRLMLESATATLNSLSKQLALATTIVQGLSTGGTEPPDTGLSEKNRPRDTSRWKLDGRYHPKGRFLLEVFKKYVDGKMSLSEVENQFNPDVVFAGKVIQGNRVLYQLVHEVKDPKRFHTDQVITTKDGKKLVVSSQFGINNFPDLLLYLAAHFGLVLKMEGEVPYSNEWRRLLGK